MQTPSDAHQQKRCVVYVEFIIRGEIHPEDITRLIGIVPDRTWHKGTPIPYSPSGRFPDSGWQLSTERNEERDVLVVLEPLIGRIESRRSEIKQLRERDSVRVYISIVVELEPVAPAFYVNATLLQRLANLGVDLDIDLYARGLANG